MASKSTQKLSHMVTCPICLEVLNNPVMMNCFHFYCHPCLVKTKKIIEGEKVGYNCPMCRQFTAEDELHRTPFMHDLLEAFELAKDEQPCCICKKEIPIWRCVDCKSMYCVTCRETHDKIPICVNHKCVSLEGASKDVCVDKLVFCKVHPEKVLELNCTSCDELICVLCKAIGHDGHKAQTISDALKRILPELQVNKARIENSRKRSLRSLDALKTDAAAVEQSYVKRQKQADDKLAEVIRKARAEHAKETKHFEEKKTTEISDFKKKINDLDLKTKAQESVLSWADTTLQNAHDASLLLELQSGLRETLLSMGKEVALSNVSRYISFPLYLIKSAKFQCEKKLNACGRFTIIDNEIWACHDAADKISILSLDLKQVRDIRLQGTKCRSVVTVDKYVAVATETGLQLIEKDQNYIVTKITEGDFVDVSARYGDIYALQDNTCEVIICTKQSESKWQKTAVLKLSGYIASIYNTLQVTHDGFYVCLRKNHCIKKYNDDGTLMATYGKAGAYIATKRPGYLSGPRLYGIDSNGDMLVVEYGNDRIQLLKSDGSLEILCKDIGNKPIGAVTDHDGTRMFVYYSGGKWETFSLHSQ